MHPYVCGLAAVMGPNATFGSRSICRSTKDLHGSGVGLLSQFLLICKSFVFTNPALLFALRCSTATGGERFQWAFVGNVQANHEKALEQLLVAGATAATLKAGGRFISCF